MTGKWIVMALAAAALLGGCGNNNDLQFSSDDDQNTPIAPQLIARSASPIEDVPVPIGFELGEKQTLEFGAGSARYLQHRYEGRADKWELKRFFKRQMQVNRWQFVNYVVAEGEFTLEYEKDSERCRILINEGTWLRSTKVMVRLWTSGPIKINPPATPAVSTATPRTLSPRPARSPR